MEKTLPLEKRLNLEEIVRENRNDAYIIERVYSIIKNLKDNYSFQHVLDRNEGFGLIFVVDDEKNFKEFYAQEKIGSMDKDYFENNLSYNIRDKCIEEVLYDALQHDGAVLISRNGDILHGGYMITVNPRKILDERKIPNNKPMPQRLGFSDYRGTKHTSAAAGSYEMQTSIFFVLSSEYGDITIIKNGSIYKVIENEEVKETKQERLPEFVYS